MRSIWLIFGFLLLALLGIGFYLRRPAPAPRASQALYAPPIVLASQRAASTPAVAPAADTLRAGIVRFALRQLGVPYLYAGGSPVSGFDCSGFLQYVYGHFGVVTPHSTALLISAGRPVPRTQAQPGDLVVFTGTAEGSTTPGHAGIVISALGETPLRFVHASSARRESGVKVSQVENSGYERRFMQVRRVLGGAGSGQPVAVRRAVTQVQPASAVAALPSTTPEVLVPAPAPLPTRVTPLSRRPKLRAHYQAAKTVLRSKPAPASRKVPAKKPLHKATPKHR